MGTGILHWTATFTEPWLSLQPQSGAGDASVTVSVDATGLPAADYSGKIVVESVPGKGSTFSVRLPTAGADEACVA